MIRSSVSHIGGLLLALLALASAAPARAQDADLLRIKNQIAERLLATPAVKDARFMGAEAKEQGVPEWTRSLAADGSWPDIRYDDKTVGAWSPILHLGRVVELAKAYASPADPLHHDPALRAALHSALGYWFVKDYRSPNWFHNEIRIPQYLGYILIMLGDEITAGERAKGLKRMADSSIKMTGQNRVWLACNVLMKGVLENNVARVQEARDAIEADYAITADEGLQADYSFHQHGALLENGGYGMSFLTFGVDWMNSLSGTRFTFSPEKTAVLRNFVLQGTNLAIWNGYMDISIAGRGLFPGVQANKAAQIGHAIAALEKSDPTHAADYQKALRSYSGPASEADQITGNKLFWRSDFMIDRRPGYYASVKMSSKRVLGTEVINKENLSGALLGDSALYLYKTGREYEDIFPVWDWHKIPGVTAASKGKLLPSRPQNAGEFVGGVTDGTDGVAVLDYNRTNLLSRNPLGLTAKKSWFFFDGQVVCLGTAITSELFSDITTSVNQCLLQGPVVVAHDNQTATLPPGRKDYPSLQWAWHDGTGYVFAQPASVTVGGAEQKGSWDKVYSAGSADSVAKTVFALWINHGTKPRDASYAYTILPSVTQAQMPARAAAPAAKILSNTTQLQAVRTAQITAAVFYEPGRLTYAPNLTVAVDHPCVVLIKESPQGPRLTVADPTQRLTALIVTWNGKPITVTLPAGLNAGTSVAVPLP